MATTVREGDPPIAPARVRVLIADDDLDVRVLLKRWLQRHGHFDVAEEAADGVQAVDAARRSQPELVVLDLAMPRMDGLEAAAEIRRLLPDTRIVIRSAFSADRMAQRAIDAGADVYVEKAADRAQLLRVLEGLFPGRDTGSGSGLSGVNTASAPTQAPLDDLLLDALDVGVLLVDHDSRVRSANFAATLALGIPTRRLVGSCLSDLLARARHEGGPRAGAGGTDPVTEALASGRPQSGRVVQLDRPGEGPGWLSFNVRPIGGAEGAGVTGAVAVITDVTEERRLRGALRDADERVVRLLDEVSALEGQLIGHDEVVAAWEPAGSESSGRTAPAPGRGGPWVTTELLEAAVISSPVGAVLLDSAARLVIANPVADRLLGGSLLLGSGPASRILRWPATREPVRDEDLPVQAACQGVPFDDLELLVTEDDGADSDTYVRVSGRPVLGPQSSPAGAVISVLDDTAAHEAEQALATVHEELRRSNTELADFASIASHELAQPLQKIYGFAELLQEDGLEDARARQRVDRIVVGCERMRTLIRDLLTYSRVTSAARPFETVDLATVVQEVVDVFEQRITDRGARIEVDPLPTVLADRTQMSELFQNLVGNALTYVASDVEPVIHIHSARRERVWHITVEDNGIGISPEDRERAFAMFERLVTPGDYPGTGIGLALCAKIVERQGGRIWIDGKRGGGTIMSFTLPDRPQG